MRNIKTFEKLGVPDNILEVANKLYDKIFNDLKTNQFIVRNSSNENGDKCKFFLSFKIADKIADLKLDRFKIIVEVDIIDINRVKDNKFKSGDIVYSGMTIPSSCEPDIMNNKLRNVDVGDNSLTEIIIRLYSIENKPNQYNILAFLLSKKNKIVTSLAHELKHRYDVSKKLDSTIKSRIEYSSYGRNNIDLAAIKKFYHYFYYITAIENLVRPTEVYSDIKFNNIKKSDFKEFLNNNYTYTQLKAINKYSLNEFKNDLKDEMYAVVKILKDNMPDEKFANDEERIERIMEVAYIQLCNSQISDYHKFLMESGFEKMFGLSSDKERMFNEMSKKITKYENNISGFFADSIKMFKFASDKMIKKISKLYDMANDNSTIQYDLHNKINSKDKKFETTILKFENFNTDAKLHLDDIKAKLSDKLSAVNWFKGDVNDRVEQLVNIHSKYIELSYNVLSIDAIVNSLFDYERILKLGM